MHGPSGVESRLRAGVFFVGLVFRAFGHRHRGRAGGNHPHTSTSILLFHNVTQMDTHVPESVTTYTSFASIDRGSHIQARKEARTPVGSSACASASLLADPPKPVGWSCRSFWYASSLWRWQQ